MSYTISWYTPDKVLYLEFNDTPQEKDLLDINNYVMDVIDKYEGKLSIVINMMKMRAGYETANKLRDTQAYMNHPAIESAFFVTDNKLNRLITILAFNLARARIVQFNDLKITREHLSRKGFHTSLAI